MVGECHGPSTIAVTVIGLSAKADVTTGGDFFAQATKISAELVVADESHFAVLESGTQAKGQLFLDRWSKVDGLDFPAEALPGAFGELHTNSSAVNAGTFEVRKSEE